VLDAGDLRFAADEDDSGSTCESAASSRRAVVVPLSVPPRPARAVDADAAAPADSQEDSTIEAVLAAFAHDLRNPMATLKTFAGLAADGGGDLALLAADACERIDEHLDLLQRYSEIVSRPADVREIDVVEFLGEAVDSAGAEQALEIAARGSISARWDAASARFVCSLVVAECVAHADAASTAAGTGEGPAGPAVADAAADGTSVSFRIPVGRAAIDRLDGLLGGGAVPWRLAIARDVVRRAGGALDVAVADGEIRIEWRLMSAAQGVEPAGLRAVLSKSAPASRTGPAARRPKAKPQ